LDTGAEKGGPRHHEILGLFVVAETRHFDMTTDVFDMVSEKGDKQD
jgi:hypothetical protein